MADAFGDLGNPYTDESADLMDLDQIIIMPQEVVDNVRNIKGLGVCKYQNFAKNMILSKNQAFTAPISQNNIKLFKHAITSTNSFKSKRKPI